MEELFLYVQNAEFIGQVDPNIRGNCRASRDAAILTTETATTKFAILNPREEVEEIQDETVNPVRCSVGRCNCQRR